ncbi:phage holin family protein [Methylobacterium isbiliense]|uniref:Phage holin family protein n=1 Tax=Methylobacterium isbiliense TaxID=315478 RepID=A0ABQ4SL75_9HYPH|nr:phage holin family protein [Methylobacterium isbiliense]MDN3627568.1 phage holin family protein [Methylobacterium isbiliense]GJE03977.1 hypothetical protein GMJLKIPL_5934 [Methylobacterium isbiliense]
MADRMARHDAQSRDSTLRLALDVVRQASDLAVKEFGLLKAEVDRIAGTVAALCASFGGAAFAACCGGFLLLVAAAKALAWLTGSEAVGACLVAAPFVLAACGLGAWGLGKVRSVGQRRPLGQ